MNVLNSEKKTRKKRNKDADDQTRGRKDRTGVIFRRGHITECPPIKAVEENEKKIMSKD
eukprot:NODE_8956_length_336_cov_129.916376_g5847_i1.p2 GENE.NODE_8956_length_336_cov_129.916376_g5847_i1~~NODE_8956_length_336_cov_129.916376_g5847_i1.p2  ORF type:complete len:59 (+),score=6.87 NODE_8956_length_336_cov_129.916376_g5847_i1:3-179(+)